ncbi:MAG: serine/threonine-protein phosphatase [Azoarcus sp.]|jgi:serine/threonine protein phosphatase PrpC|nr:serine/threonine-protein phosphatase [Azoarcus sp.]
MKFTIFQESRIGRRKNNQDRIAHCYSRDSLLMVLADGMGGHLHGEVASQIAVQYMTHVFQREAQPKLHDPVMFLSRELSLAHHAILDYALEKGLREAPRTTVVACIVQDGHACWAHAGDSRLYLLRDNRIHVQTHDHSRVQLMMDQGLLDTKSAATHPNRNRVYSCLGGTHLPQIEFSRRTPLQSGDVIALCTDGVWGPLGNEGLLRGLTAENPMIAVPRVLSEAEDIAGASCDNLSIIVMAWREGIGDDDNLPVETVSTQTMALSDFTTRMDTFDKHHRLSASEMMLSDDDIEMAIQEINAAIQKFSDTDPK